MGVDGDDWYEMVWLLLCLCVVFGSGISRWQPAAEVIGLVMLIH